MTESFKTYFQGAGFQSSWKHFKEKAVSAKQKNAVHFNARSHKIPMPQSPVVFRNPDKFNIFPIIFLCEKLYLLQSFKLFVFKSDPEAKPPTNYFLQRTYDEFQSRWAFMKCI